MTGQAKGPEQAADILRRFEALQARQRRLAIQYGLAALALAGATWLLDWPPLALAVWLVFAVYLVLRDRAARLQTAQLHQILQDQQQPEATGAQENR